MKLFVISDLHLGGRPHPPVAGQDAAVTDLLPGDLLPPDLLPPASLSNGLPGSQICHAYPELTRFIDWVATQGSAQHAVELIINGDIVDFLMEDDYPNEPDALPWLPDEARVIDKFKLILQRTRNPQQDGPFDAMARLLAQGHSLTFILGNHDVELSLPKVRLFLEQEVLRLDPRSSGRFRFIYDGEAYVRGDLLIEHGNRYDPWNMIDHSALRQERSMLSRGLGAQMLARKSGHFQPPPGSMMVIKVINVLKRKYRFVDLLKPEDKATGPILLALHPKLQHILNALIQFDQQAAVEVLSPVQAGVDGKLSRGGKGAAFDLAHSLQLALGEEAGALAALQLEANPSASALGAADAFALIKKLSGNINKWLGDAGNLFDAAAPKARQRLLLAGLRQWRGAMRIRTDVEAPEYTAAISELAQGGFRTIVFGHTHLPKYMRFDPDSTYINTGTWADIMRLPLAVLTEQAQENGQFQAFLQDLEHNRIAPYIARQLSYAQIELASGPQGEYVQTSQLCEFLPEQGA